MDCDNLTTMSCWWRGKDSESGDSHFGVAAMNFD